MIVTILLHRLRHLLFAIYVNKLGHFLVAILLHKLGHYLHLWLTKKKIDEVRAKQNGFRIFFEFGGTIFNLIIAFILLVILGFVIKERRLPNDNLIYGIQFCEVAKEFGFRDGDKIVSINGKEVEYFNNVFHEIISSKKGSEVVVDREGTETIVHVPDQLCKRLIESNEKFEIMPRYFNDTQKEYLKYEEKRIGFKGAVSINVDYVVSFYKYFNSNYRGIGGFRTGNFLAQLSIMPLFLFFLICINLLPIPGMDMGNALIALWEKKRKKPYNSKKLTWVRYTGSVITVSMLFGILYFFTR